MITDKQLQNLSKLSREDLHLILQEIVTELLVPVTVKNWKIITGDKRSERAIYNAVNEDRIKSIEIDNHKLPYVNW